MTPHDLLASRRRTLEDVVRASSGDKPHLDGFVARVLGKDLTHELMPGFEFVCPPDRDAVRYEGFPRAAHIGFGIGAGALTAGDAGSAFIESIARLQHRSGQMLDSLASDDVALLGLADGLVQLRLAGCAVPDGLSTWLVSLTDSGRTSAHWLSRVRDLGADLLDGRGRVNALPSEGDVDARALEFTLRSVWSPAFSVAHDTEDSQREALLKDLLSAEPPRRGELERAVVWLRALDELVGYAARTLLLTISDTVRILEDIQHALKRWRPHERARRRDVRPGTWLIDDEYDVQTLLWLVLYPIFGADLVDESYLPNWGFTQPRLDLGIESLGLIIEAKIARSSADYKDIEAEVHADLGLYFKESSRFDRMIVFIYDDSDRYVPEKVDGLRNALLKRDRIDGVVVVRRPSVMPARGDRHI